MRLARRSNRLRVGRSNMSPIGVLRRNRAARRSNRTVAARFFYWRRFALRKLREDVFGEKIKFVVKLFKEFVVGR